MDQQTSLSSKKKPNQLLNALKIGLMILVGAGIGYFLIGEMLPKSLLSELKSDLGPIQKILLIPALIIPAFVVIAVHELGHLLTGLMQGFKFQLYIVGPLGIKRDEDTDRIKWYFNKELNVAGGLAATIPEEDDPANITKFARLVIAGPLASLLLGVLLLLIGRYFSGMIGLLMLFGGIMSLLIFVITIFPAGSPTFMTDGKRFLRLLKPETRTIEMAIMRLSAAYSKTRTYENLQVEDIELMKTDPTPMLNMMAYFYAYLHYLSIGAFEKAAEEEVVFRKKAEQFPKGFRSMMDKEIIRIRKRLGLEAALEKDN